MFAKTMYSKHGITQKIEIKLTKRDLAKVFAVVVLAEVFAQAPLGALRKSAIGKAADEMTTKIGDEVARMMNEYKEKVVEQVGNPSNN